MPVTVVAGPDWPLRAAAVADLCQPHPLRIDAAAAAGRIASAARQPSLFGPAPVLCLYGAEDAPREVLDEVADAGTAATIVVDAASLSAPLRAAVKRHGWPVTRCDAPNGRTGPRRAVQRARRSYPSVPADLAETVGRRCGDDVAAVESVLAALHLVAPADRSAQLVEDLCRVAAAGAAWNISGPAAAVGLLAGSVSAPAWLASRAAAGDPQLVAWLRNSRSGMPVEAAAVAAALGAHPQP